LLSTPETGGLVCQFQHPTLYNLSKGTCLLKIPQQDPIIYIEFLTIINIFAKLLKNRHFMAKNYEIDNTDLRILEILMEDAKKPFTEVAKKVFVSQGTVHVRMSKMEAAGIVERNTLKINYAKLGYDITAFIGIYLEKSALYDKVLTRLKEIPEITNIHYTTGNYSMFLKIHCRDTNHLKEVLHDKMQQVEGIDRTETMISLEESLDRSLRLAN
jgi:Lrp/AsnC family transcriptional regulator for asnA, asnC and gidA